MDGVQVCAEEGAGADGTDFVKSLAIDRQRQKYSLIWQHLLGQHLLEREACNDRVVHVLRMRLFLGPLGPILFAARPLGHQKQRSFLWLPAAAPAAALKHVAAKPCRVFLKNREKVRWR